MIKNLNNEVLSLKVQYWRGKALESEHQVVASVMNGIGEEEWSYGLSKELGPKEILVYPRSSIKMLQALPFVELGVMDHFGWRNDYLALACASHHGERMHLEKIKQWLKDLKLTNQSLVCGAHMPLNKEAANALIKRGKKPTSLHNNCSGKHLALLSTCLFLKEDTKNYYEYKSNSQKRLRDLLSELTGINLETAPWGIDGCGIPTYALSVYDWANTLRIFLSNSQQKMSLTHKYAESSQRIVKAVQKYPYFLSGKGSFSSELMRVTKGKCLAKGGAEGVFAVWDLKKNKVIFLKVKDGADRASSMASFYLLKKLKSLSLSEIQQLSPFVHENIYNWAGEKVGKIVVKEQKFK